MNARPLFTVLAASVLLASNGFAQAANQTYTKAGQYELKLPTNAGKVTLMLVGAGGGGGGGGGAAGGGGGGGQTMVCSFNMQPGTTLWIGVGGGGKAGAVVGEGEMGGNGSASTFGKSGFSIAAEGGMGGGGGKAGSGGQSPNAGFAPDCGVSEGQYGGSGSGGTAGKGGNATPDEGTRLFAAARDAALLKERDQLKTGHVGSAPAGSSVTAIMDMHSSVPDRSTQNRLAEIEAALKASPNADVARVESCKASGAGGDGGSGGAGRSGADGCVSIDY